MEKNCRGRAGRDGTRAEVAATGAVQKRDFRQKSTNRLTMNASEAIPTRNLQDASESAGPV